MSQVIIEAFSDKKDKKVDGIVLKISEFFSDTLQGEGVTIGVPSTFLRLQNCILSCSWCDTTEVWRQGNSYSINELLDLIQEHQLHQRFQEGQHLILTGGSPLLQQVPLTYFIEQFILRFGFKPYIEVENECVRQPLDGLIELVDQWNNSPKLNNSGMKVLLRYKPEVLTFMNSLRNSWFKFVIENEEDWKEVERDFLETEFINREKVILMPCGDTQEKLNITRPIVADLACRENVRFSDRLHVTIWDKKTGV